jgi:hypothetical protein
MSFPRYPAYEDPVFEPPRPLDAIDADLARVTRPHQGHDRGAVGVE